MPAPDNSLIGRAARQLTQAPAYADTEGTRSLLVVAAASYGLKSDPERTQPTGFDPEAARLFEAVVESAFLVANADGNFDTTERAAFQHIVVTACGGAVAELQVSALLADLHDQLDEDGMQKRIQMVARNIVREDHAREVLRVSSLLAHVSGGVSSVERDVLDKLAAEFKLTGAAVEQAMRKPRTRSANSVLGQGVAPESLVFQMDMMPDIPATFRSERPAKVIHVLSDDGTLDPRHDPRLSESEVLQIYTWMVTTRQLDERLVALQRQGRIGFHVGSLGEEAAIIGSAFAMRKSDWLFPCYREFGAALMRGLPLQTFVDNMFGNANDTALGRQMPNHSTHRASGWTSVSSPVGTQITQAVGFSWGAKIDGKDVASLVYFGDGATSSTDFHSGMNFAGVFKVPVVFLCRNNGWAISVPVERQTATSTFAEKAAAYGIPGVRVDGNDIFAVVSAVREAVRRGEQGLGPTMIEAITYRMGGHSTSDDPNRYRATDELKPWAERDPLERLRQYLERRKLWDDRKEQALIADIDQRFRAAVGIAEKAGPPPLESMFQDVYEKPPWHLQEQCAEVLRGPRAPSSH